MASAGAVMWYTVLPVGLDPEATERVRDALAPLDAVVTAGADDWSEALDLASAGRYDGLVVGYPLGDAPVAGFLACLRRPTCPCRNSAIVLITDDRYRAEGETYLGRGANRVLTWDEAPLRLPDVLEDLFKAAPRVLVELSVRVMPVNEGPVGSVACRTVNVSSSGMLLRLAEGYRPGTVLVFEMVLPGSVVPVCGHARVVRRTSVRREPFPGVGVAFAGLHDNARARLASFLQCAVA
ncbi:MAG: PilZ domain-containing protein [Acidobacteriia bacterium]|nr:PilZ domain-containing protein [Terriglobia bacterium]